MAGYHPLTLCADRRVYWWLDTSGVPTEWVGEARRDSRAGATSTAESLPRTYGPGPRFSGYCVSGAARRRVRAARARGWLCYSVARQTPLPVLVAG